MTEHQEIGYDDKIVIEQSGVEILGKIIRNASNLIDISEGC